MLHVITIITFWAGISFQIAHMLYRYVERMTRPSDPPPLREIPHRTDIPWTGRPDDTSEITKDWQGE